MLLYQFFTEVSMPKISIVLLLCSVFMSNSSFGSNIEEQKHRIKNSIMLTILGKNVSQFISMGIATGHQDALRANRNKTEITFEDKASIIFDIFQDALFKVDLTLRRSRKLTKLSSKKSPISLDLITKKTGLIIL